MNNSPLRDRAARAAYAGNSNHLLVEEGSGIGRPAELRGEWGSVGLGLAVWYEVARSPVTRKARECGPLPLELERQTA